MSGKRQHANDQVQVHHDDFEKLPYHDELINWQFFTRGHLKEQTKFYLRISYSSDICCLSHYITLTPKVAKCEKSLYQGIIGLSAWCSSQGCVVYQWQKSHYFHLWGKHFIPSIRPLLYLIFHKVTCILRWVMSVGNSVNSSLLHHIFPGCLTGHHPCT